MRPFFFILILLILNSCNYESNPNRNYIISQTQDIDQKVDEKAE